MYRINAKIPVNVTVNKMNMFSYLINNDRITIRITVHILYILRIY